ncbi:MAG: nucleotide sugar dehydrogenase [Nitrospirota bacterium]|nr:nucleotide sugar dehydrogenase [Nitrospirota bacterium]
MKDQLIAKLGRHEATIGVVGLGYVGLPLVLRYVESGYRVLGLDVDPKKPPRLLQGQSYIEHITATPLKAAAEDRRFDATTDFSRAGECDAIILCVPTPLTRHREPDMSYVIGSVEALVPHLRAGQALSLESTTYPGTTRDHIFPRVTAAGFSPGENLFLIYSPEREDPANPDFTTRTIPKVVGGFTPACLEVGVALYQGVIDRLVPVSSCEVAEMTKILENTYRAVNIALVNELKQVTERMGIDVFEVIRASATKPFGFTPFFPGPGLGGHCIPIDPFYLTWKAREYGVATRFIELAGEVNTAMPDYVVHKVGEVLNQSGMALRGSRVMILGVAYKKNVDDVRETPAAVIIERLTALGAEVSYSDPHVPVFPHTRKHQLDLKSIPLSKESLSAVDVVLLVTDHDRIDWDLVRNHAPRIVDPRGRFVPDGKKVFRA